MRLPALWLLLTWLLLAGLFLLLTANMKEDIPSTVNDNLTNKSEFDKWELKYLGNESGTPSFTGRKLSDPLDNSVLNFEENDTISVGEIFLEADRDTENLTSATTNIHSGKLEKNLKSGVEYNITVQEEQFSVIKVNSDSKLGTLKKEKPSNADDRSLLSSIDTDTIVAEEKVSAMNIDNYWQQLYASPHRLNVTELERLLLSVENYISDEAEPPHAIRLGHDCQHQMFTRDVKSERMQEDGPEGRRSARDISTAAMQDASHEMVNSMKDEILSPMEYFNDQEHRVLKKDDPSKPGDKGPLNPANVEVVILDDNLSAMNIDNYWQQLYASPKKLNVTELERLKYSVENYNSVHAEQAGSRTLAQDSEHRIVRRDVETETLQEDFPDDTRYLLSDENLNGTDFKEIGRCLLALTNISLECYINCNDTEHFRNIIRSSEYCFYQFAGLCKDGTYCGEASISMDVDITASITETRMRNTLTQDNINCLNEYISMSMLERSLSICRVLEECGLVNETDCNLQLSKPYSILDNSCVWPAEVDGDAICPKKTDEVKRSILTKEWLIVLCCVIGILFNCLPCYRNWLRRLLMRDVASLSDLETMNFSGPSNTAQNSEPVVNENVSENVAVEVPLPALSSTASSCNDVRETSATVESPGNSGNLFCFPKLPTVEESNESIPSYMSIENLSDIPPQSVYNHIDSSDSMNANEMLGE